MTEAPNEIPITCPRCGTQDKPGAKPMIELNNGNYTCVGCGWTFVPTPPAPDAAGDR